MGLDVARLEARLTQWRARLEVLAAQVEEAGSLPELELLQRIDDLKARCAITQARIDRAVAAARQKT